MRKNMAANYFLSQHKNDKKGANAKQMKKKPNNVNKRYKQNQRKTKRKKKYELFLRFFL